MPVEEIPLEEFVMDPRLQCREAVYEQHVNDLVDALRDGVKLPPGLAYRDADGRCYLADGYHRREAHRRAGQATFPCEVKPGNVVAAVQAAAASNKSHGLKRTNEDKRKAVNNLLDLPECEVWSVARLAKHVGVSIPFVSDLRARRGTPAPAVVLGTDGREHQADTRGNRGGKRLPPPAAKQCQENEKSAVGNIVSDVAPVAHAASLPPPEQPREPEPEETPTAELGPAATKAKHVTDAWNKAKYALGDFAASLRELSRVIGPHAMPLNAWEQQAAAWVGVAQKEVTRRLRELDRQKAPKQPAAGGAS